MDTYKTMPSVADKMKKISQHQWDVENLVFEGGGAKMVAYAGGCKVLEELGILQKCKRFAGTSGGAIAAALLATGHSADEMRELMALPMQDLLCDSWRISLPVNLWRKFGWHSAKPFLLKVKEILKNKTDIDDITFRQVYNNYGKELCIVATNVSTATVEFFHPKTTPDVSVAEAVRCSVSLPGLLQPMEIELPSKLKQLYVDGGVMINYPLHVFDSWGLSMKEEDSFFKKFHPKRRMFGGEYDINYQTLGMNLFTFAEDDVMKQDFIRRTHQTRLKRPNTKLARQRQEETDKMQVSYGAQTARVTALNILLDTLQQLHKEPHDNISLETFDRAIDKIRTGSPNAMNHLYKDEEALEKTRDLIKQNGNQMTLQDMVIVQEKKGLRWSQLIRGGVQTNHTSCLSFFCSIYNAVSGLTRISSLKPEDSDRTIGIFTDYVQTGDFDLAEGDIDFLVAKGQIGTVEYFDYILKKHEKQGVPPDIQAARLSLRVERRSKLRYSTKEQPLALQSTLMMQSKVGYSTIQQPLALQRTLMMQTEEDEEEDECDPFENIRAMEDQ